jgi:choloylglycine hydrolase
MRRTAALACVLAACAAPATACACTTFCLRGEQGPVFGRNFDYAFGEALVLANPRGVAKRSIHERNPARWVSRYGSLTFTQYGKDSPMGGMNERGLVVEVMDLAETRMPDVDARPSLEGLEWIQYLLDRFATVPEALDGARRVRPQTNAAIHFLLADRDGDSAAVEFLGGRMVVRRGDDLPVRVLANSPYDDSLEFVAGTAPAPRTPEGRSLERFARAARLVKEDETSAEPGRPERAFAILEAVRQEGHTKWQVVYDIARGTVHYRTANNPENRRVSLGALDFTCGHASLIDIDTGRGDLAGSFVSYTAQANERLMLSSFARTPRAGMAPDDVRREAARLESRECTAG